jgi:hypothetical protein
MSVPYFARLLCLSLAAFFLVHLVVSGIVRAITTRAIQIADQMSARDGARLLFALRLAPGILGAALVIGVCAPSYLWLEPQTVVEQIGPGCRLAAALGAACWAHAIARSGRAALRSSRYRRNC